MRPESSLKPLLQDLWEGMRSRPGRFGLSVFAMAVGMTVLTVLIILLDGLQERSRRLGAELGTNVIAILPGDKLKSAVLTSALTRTLRANYPYAVLSGLKVVSVPGGDAGGTINLVGVDETLISIRQWPLAAGRFFDAVDVKEQQRYAVISAPLRERWGWQVGNTIILRDTPYIIIGIVDYGGEELVEQFGDARLVTGEATVFVPLPIIMNLVSDGEGSVELDAIYMRVSGERDPGAVLPGVQNLLAQQGIAADDLTWIIPASLLRSIERLQGTIALAVGTMALLSLILGGTTLSSLLIANVRERIAEIGLRRSLGATPVDITTLFIVEGCLVTTSASVTGVILVHLLFLQDLPLLSELPVSLGMRSIMLPVLFALALGVLFSWWPARSAARIRPADALRAD